MSAFHDHLVARSGTIVSIRFCGTSCLKRTRLLKTAIIGFWAELNASSWIDMLAGLSYWKTRSTPPRFCADADFDRLVRRGGRVIEYNHTARHNYG